MFLQIGTFRTTVSQLSTPAGFPACETQMAAPQPAPITTQFHIKRRSQEIAVDASWREVTKVACCLKDGALWHDPEPTLISRSLHNKSTFSKRLEAVQFYQPIAVK